jgi:hypothetical protein
MNRILIFVAGMIVLVLINLDGRSQSTDKPYKLLKKSNWAAKVAGIT